MSAFWYYAEGSETIGPVAFDELVKMLSLLKDARGVLVWRDGFNDWKAAETVREIAEKIFRPPPVVRMAASGEVIILGRIAYETRIVLDGFLTAIGTAPTPGARCQRPIQDFGTASPDLAAVWEEHGVSVLQRLAVTEPAKLAQIAYGLLVIETALRADHAKLIEAE